VIDELSRARARTVAGLAMRGLTRRNRTYSGTVTVVRVSILNIPADRLVELQSEMTAAEAALSGIKQLRGLKMYFVGVDADAGQFTNVSVWDTVDDAKQMSSFQPMLDLATRFAAVEGVSFVRPIANFSELWKWGDASGAK
jgi:hypothetical protein